jgi:hypothetical protein
VILNVRERSCVTGRSDIFMFRAIARTIHLAVACPDPDEYRIIQSRQFFMLNFIYFLCVSAHGENYFLSFLTGLPDGSFSNQKNPNLGQFMRAIDRRLFKYFLDIWNFYGHLEYFETIWYILFSFGTFFHILVSCTKKNLATLVLEHISNFHFTEWLLM